MATKATKRIVEPIRSPFVPEKSKAWHYKIHPYHTKQSSNIVSEYIRHFCPEGGLVVDPFCGSGVTAIESIANGRRTICMDLDPLAVFITRQTCFSPVDLNAFWDAFHYIEKELEPIVNFVRGASGNELQRYKLKEWYPKAVKLPSNADRRYVEDLFARSQLIPLAHLRSAIMRVKDEQIKELLLFAFSGTLPLVNLSCMEAGWGSRVGIFTVHRYWVGRKPWIRDVWEVFKGRVRLVASAKAKSNALLGGFFREGYTFNVHCDSAENLIKYVDKESVDYIYTDPPYGAHIAYLDLSTMWHAWLGFQISDEMRGREAIEGGEKRFDERHYLDVLQKSFEQMFYALKDEAWLSLVFHHKKTNLWYSIRDMLRYVGFNYVNTVAQPVRPSTAEQTFHKTKHPLRVLGESLIVNFLKSSRRVISVPMSLPLANIIKNIAERVIYRNGGATTEEILREVVPDLFENELFIDAATKSMGDILGILESDFDLDNDNLWQIRAERKVGNFIPPKVRIQYYVIGYLRKHKRASFDDIVTTILPLLINGHKPTKDDIADVLREIAKSVDGVHWQLIDPNAVAIQNPLRFDDEIREEIYEVPDSTTHNQQIYRLAVLCRKLGYVPCIGKKEHSDPMFATLKSLNSLNVKADEVTTKRIEQIDLVWVDDEARPIWAFEIEEHTSILSALERFTSLLQAAPDMGTERLLTIVAPKSRRKKLHQELTSSSYIGHPQYLENKMTYLFSDDLEKFFIRSRTKRTLLLTDLKGICKAPVKQ